MDFKRIGATTLEIINKHSFNPSVLIILVSIFSVDPYGLEMVHVGLRWTLIRIRLCYSSLTGTRLFRSLFFTGFEHRTSTALGNVLARII